MNKVFLSMLFAGSAFAAESESTLIERFDAAMDFVDERLFVECKSCDFRADLSGLADLEFYTIDQRPPGLLFSTNDELINPRLSLFLDTRLGKHFYSLVQVRADRGFDPGLDPDGDIRADEYFLRYTPLDEPLVNLQVGKFATVYGNWVRRHDSWHNPFINAPLPYENVTTITDQSTPALAGSPVTAFLGRRGREDQKGIWLPVIWGPSYASGASVFGTFEKFDYAFEVKNASLSSRSAVWDATDQNWRYPTYTGRVGYRPNATWDIGANGSYGAYLLRPARATLPPGQSLGAYNQITFGPDITFAWRHLQIWAEAMAARFEVPGVGNADTVTYYIESRYKITPNLYGALRWNQQIFDDVTDATGARTPWDDDIWRAEAAIGFKISRHLLTKLQYSYAHQKGGLQQGEQMLAAQLTLKF